MFRLDGLLSTRRSLRNRVTDQTELPSLPKLLHGNRVEAVAPTIRAHMQIRRTHQFVLRIHPSSRVDQRIFNFHYIFLQRHCRPTGRGFLSARKSVVRASGHFRVQLVLHLSSHHRLQFHPDTSNVSLTQFPALPVLIIFPLPSKARRLVLELRHLDFWENSVQFQVIIATSPHFFSIHYRFLLMQINFFVLELFESDLKITAMGLFDIDQHLLLKVNPFRFMNIIAGNE